MIFNQKEILFLNWFLYVMINNNIKNVYIKMVSCMDIEKDLEGNEMTRENKIKWKKSIQARQIFGFTLIILFMIVSSVILQVRTMNFAVKTTYEKMNANAETFLESFENELTHIRQLQINFFSDRKLSFLISPMIKITEYERREALLSVRERLQMVTGISRLVESGILCLPETGYWIVPSGIGRISQENMAVLEEYLSYEAGKIHFDGTGFFIMETGAVRSTKNISSDHILIITFSAEAIKDKMSMINASEDMGSFFYLEEQNYLLSSREESDLENEIYEKLKRDETGNYLNVQRIKINREWYLISVGGTGDMGVFVQYTKETPIMAPINRFRNAMILVIVFMIVMSFGFIIYMRRLIHRPINILLRAFANLEEGDWSTAIKHIEEDEFGQLYGGFNKMKEHISRLIEEVYVKTNLAQRMQLKHLQAQINPHFLYNSFFVLSRRIKREDYENAQIIAEHLGDYFQFLTRNESDYIPLKKEAEHAKCYSDIQAARFVDRICVEFNILPEEVEHIKVPRLILQPLLENVFEHGLYNKEENGIMRVNFTVKAEALRIDVEDNGDDITDDDINRMQELLEKEDDGQITGITNIHKRLKYYFKGKGGLEICRSALGGLCVTVKIDKGEWEDGTESVDC